MYGTNLSRRPSSRRALGFLILGLALPSGGAPPATAAQFFVTTTADAIPAPPGSLRAAIELSEQNGEADSIHFLVDGGTIFLVAPLPRLDEGRLAIGQERTTGVPAPVAPLQLSGANGVPLALEIRSGGNTVTSLGFVAFQGSEVVLIRGTAARGNNISGCVFGSDEVAGANSGAAIRIHGAPPGTEVAVNRFVRNGAGIVIDGAGLVLTPGPWSHIRDNWFGTDAAGAAGPGNGEAIRARDGGPVLIASNRFSGPGAGITLGPGSDGSLVSQNEAGLMASAVEACSGFDAAALSVEGASGVTIQNNRFSCSQTGILLFGAVAGTELRDNTLGGRAPLGNLLDGITLVSASGVLIRGNTITGNGRFGVSASDPVVDPGPPGNVLACNAIWGNVAGALDLPDVLVQPPVLISATAVDVAGSLASDVSGWVEVFGDDGAQARLFQGATSVPNTGDPSFRHRLPVLGMQLLDGSSGTRIDFARETPANHTATLTDAPALETSALSDALASAQAVLYDLIRGDVANLSPASAGGIDLGPVTCLASSLPPNSGPVIDPAVPLVGEAFFYLARRRGGLVNVLGTYDPAICLTEVKRFGGPRVASSGDCQ